MIISYTYGTETAEHEAEIISRFSDGYVFKSRTCPESGFGSNHVDEDGNILTVKQLQMGEEGGKAMYLFSATIY